MLNLSNAPVAEKHKNMYGDSIEQLPWFQGCGIMIDLDGNGEETLVGHNCKYCGFRLQAYRQKPHFAVKCPSCGVMMQLDELDKWLCPECGLLEPIGTAIQEKTRGCEQCYNFETHLHPERFKKYPGKKTSGDQFNWIGASGEPAFLGEEDMQQILEQVALHPDRQYFMQTKDPRWLLDYEYPDNLWIGITLETNRDEGYEQFSNAPKPSVRVEAVREWIECERNLHSITIEPIMKFDLNDLMGMIVTLSPDIIYLGYNSKPKHCALPEPTLAETRTLIKAIKDETQIRVKEKLMREAI